MAKKKMSMGAKFGLGVAATTAAAAAAGAYFLYGAKDAAKNRKVVKSWALKAKGEVLEGIEKARTMNEKDYAALVDRTVAKYKKVRSVSAAEAVSLSRELKSHWKHIHKAMPTGRQAAAPKKASKKTKSAPKRRKTAGKKGKTYRR